MELFDDKFISLRLEDELCRVLYELGRRCQTAQTLHCPDVHQPVVVLVHNIHLLVPLKALDGHKVVRERQNFVAHFVQTVGKVQTEPGASPDCQRRKLNQRKFKCIKIRLSEPS